MEAVATTWGILRVGEANNAANNAVVGEERAKREKSFEKNVLREGGKEKAGGNSNPNGGGRDKKSPERKTLGALEVKIAKAGLEPARPSRARDFKSPASAIPPLGRLFARRRTSNAGKRERRSKERRPLLLLLYGV